MYSQYQLGKNIYCYCEAGGDCCLVASSYNRAMKNLITFHQGAGGNDGGEPEWVKRICDGYTRRYIEQRCVHLIDVGRFGDVEAIREEFYD